MLSNLSSRAGELKSQGAAQAAQDSNSNVNAQDAQNVMADESKKAGVAASNSILMLPPKKKLPKLAPFVLVPHVVV